MNTGSTSGSHARMSYYSSVESGYDSAFTWEEDRTFFSWARPSHLDNPMYTVTGRVDAADKTFPHIGFKFASNGELQATIADGSTEDTATLLSNPSATDYRLRAEWDADNSVAEFFVDGQSEGTMSTNIPTGGTEAESWAYHIAENPGTAANRELTVYDMRVIQYNMPDR